MDENKKYAVHMISWIEKLGLPDSDIAKTSFDLVKQYWIDNVTIDLEKLREDLWRWCDANDGLNTSKPEVCKMRMVLCLAYEDNRELEDMGFFEDLLHSLGISYDDAYNYKKA